MSDVRLYLHQGVDFFVGPELLKDGRWKVEIETFVFLLPCELFLVLDIKQLMILDLFPDHFRSGTMVQIESLDVSPR